VINAKILLSDMTMIWDSETLEGTQIHAAFGRTGRMHADRTRKDAAVECSAMNPQIISICYLTDKLISVILKAPTSVFIDEDFQT
jgi:hypothetical protein